MKTASVLRLLLAAVAAFGGCTDSISGGGGGTTSTPPATPTGLGGALQNSGKDVALSWTDASGDETGFRIEINTGAFGAPPYAGVFFVGANVTAFVYDTTLPNTTYHFRVYAITGSAQSDPSNVFIVTTGNFPLPPFYVTALATGYTSVELRWLNGASDNGNIVERSSDQLTWTPIFNGPTGPNLQGIVDSSGLFPDAVYYYRVYAKIGSVTSGASTVASTRTQSNPSGGTVIAATSGPGVHSSLSFDDFAYHRIVSYDEWSAGLVLTSGTFPPGTYSTVQIGFGMGNGFYGCSGATDSSGVIYAASHVYGNDELQFITNQTGSWVATIIDADPGFTTPIYGRDPDIRVSPSDQSIHIVYKIENSSTGDGWLRHAWRANALGSAWNNEDILGYTAVLKGHSFRIDAAGTPHVIYSTQNTGNGIYELRHAWKSGGWNTQLVAAGGQPDMNSVAIGPSNFLHVAYKDDQAGGLWYATNQSGSWTAERVHYHTGGNVGRHNSIVYFSTASADVHISYYDAPNGNLWYAGKKGATGAWYRKLIDTANDVGRFTSINNDWTDLYVSYFDVTNSALKVIMNPQD